MRRALLLLLLAGCAPTVHSPVVLGVEIEAAEGRAVNWAQAADEIGECARKFEDPRVLNGLWVKQYATLKEVGWHCGSSDFVACYLASKKRAIVAPRDGREIPGFCHEAGHHLLNEREDDPDHCHLRSEVWKVIDGTTCTCRCPPKEAPKP